MSNKATPRSSYLTRRTPRSQLFDLNLTSTQLRNKTPLSYSQSPDMVKLIDVNDIPAKHEVFPNTSDFTTQPLCPQTNCHRKDCLDRKFKAIRATQKSSPNVKVVSPRKIDIILENQDKTHKLKREPGIHSLKRLTNRSVGEKDLLKEFRQLEQARKDLKTRKSQLNRPIHLSVNMLKSTQFSQQAREYNPENSNLYSDVRTKISRRYNSMFRKYAETCKEQLKSQQQFLKEMCQATKITSRKMRGSDSH